MWTDLHQYLLDSFATVFPPPMEDEPCRAWTRHLAEQFKFSFPTEGWGTKRADPGRPPSTDCICTESPFVGYDVIVSQGTPGQFVATDPPPLNLRGQVFIPVSAVNHLGGVMEPAPKPPAHECPKPPPYPDEGTFWKAFQDRVKLAYADAGRMFPDPNDADAFRRFSRCGYDIGAGMEAQAAANKHIAELRAELGV